MKILFVNLCPIRLILFSRRERERKKSVWQIKNTSLSVFAIHSSMCFRVTRFFLLTLFLFLSFTRTYTLFITRHLFVEPSAIQFGEPSQIQCKMVWQCFRMTNGLFDAADETTVSVALICGNCRKIRAQTALFSCKTKTKIRENMSKEQKCT